MLRSRSPLVDARVDGISSTSCSGGILKPVEPAHIPTRGGVFRTGVRADARNSIVHVVGSTGTHSRTVELIRLYARGRFGRIHLCNVKEC